MKAATIQNYGDAIEFTDIAKPNLKDDSVIIEVHTASLNPIDNILRMGYLKEMLPLTFPHVMGYDVSGVVVEVGKQVKKVKAGDAVYARPNQEDAGALAEFARVKESELAIVPANLSHTHAASVPLAGLTAWQALITKAKKGRQGAYSCWLRWCWYLCHSNSQTLWRICRHHNKFKEYRISKKPGR